jgi:hypothetical protein
MDIGEIMRLMDEVKKAGGIENFIITQISKPENAAKFGEVLNKLPDSVLNSFAAKIAERMPPVSIDADEIVKAAAAVLKPGLEEQIKQIGNAIKASGGGQVDIQAIIDTVKGQIAAQVIKDYSSYNEKLTQLATAIKEIQDRQETLIQATVEAAFKANMQNIIEQISAKIQEIQAANPNAAVLPAQGQQPKSLVGQFIDNLPTILDAWQKLNPQANQNATMWETAFKFWNMGFNSGNKTKQGVMDAGQASSEFIQTMMSSQGEKK